MLPISMIFATWSERYVEGLTAFRFHNDLTWREFFTEAAAAAVEQARTIASDLAELRTTWDTQLSQKRREQGHTRALRSDSAEFRILNGLPAHPLLTTETVGRLYGVQPNNARKALDSLAGAGILRAKVIGKAGLTGYYADDLFELVTIAERRLASTRFDTRISPPAGRPVPASPPRID